MMLGEALVLGEAFFDRRGFAEQQLKIWGHKVQMLITLEPFGLFCSYFVYLFLFKHCPVNGEEA